MNRFLTLLLAASCLTAVGQVGSQSCSTSTMISVTSENGDSVFVGEQVSFQMINHNPLLPMSCVVSGWSNPESVTVVSNDCISFNHSIHQTVIFNEPGTFWINGTIMYNPWDVRYCSISITISDVEGCTSLDFVEFNPLATIDDGSCLTAIVYGCTDFTACNFDESATVDDGSCTYLEPTWCDCDGNIPDCAGNCGGTAVVDCAGVCGGSAVADCAGECGGDRVIDCAGVCGGTAVVDCAGVCGGSAVADCAGECGGDRVIDCAGVCGGTAVVDCAGVCGGDSSSCSGCTNENATNYDSTATIEDGSCLYSQDAYDSGIAGVDITVDNQEAYDAGAASVECPPCANSDCPGDFTADGYIGVDDILSMLSLYDTSCSQ